MTGRKASILLGLLLSFTFLSAQPKVNSSSRFGHGKDSLECLLNIGMSCELVQKGKYKKAYIPWRKVITAHPLAQITSYSNGIRILHALLKEEKDSLQRASYLNELCDLYDLNLLYLDELNKQLRRPTQPDVLHMLKAHDYLTFAGECLQPEKAYTYILQALECARSPLHPQLLHDWLDIQSYARSTSHNMAGEQRQMWESMLDRINKICNQTPKE